MKISVELPGDVEKLWNDAIKLAKENGVTIEGDMNRGSFSIKGFRATYNITGRTLTAFAGKIPAFLSEKRIKDEIQNWFNERK